MREAIVGFVLMAVVANGCGKSVFLAGDDVVQGDGEQTPSPQPTPNPSSPNPDLGLSGSCPAEKQFAKIYTQPDETVNRRVDMLFVLDSSASLDTHRSKLVTELDSFTAGLSADTDLRIAVLLGHGGASPYSARLFKVDDADPAVLDSQQTSLTDVRRALLRKVQRRTNDVDEAGGEALIYSFSGLLDRIADVQRDGFLRPNASWSIVFVTDENDICYPPELHGFHSFPDYVPSARRGYELTAYRRYCLDAQRQEQITPTLLAERLAVVHSGFPVALGGVIHHLPNLTPRIGEQAVGHGVMELLGLHQRSTLIALDQPSYREGLQNLATQTVTSLELVNEFVLPSGTHLQPESVKVTVDGAEVGSTYDGSAGLVRIDLAQAGKARSKVEVKGCAP